MDKKKNTVSKTNIAIIAVFCAIIFGFLLLHIILPDNEASREERRKLAVFPVPTAKNILHDDPRKDDDSYYELLDDYLLDQFPLRSTFLSTNAVTRFYLYRMKDVNDAWSRDGRIYKIDYPLREDRIDYAAKLIDRVTDKYLEGCNVYWSVVPDKNYYSATANGYPSLDYERLVEIMRGTLVNEQYVDLFGTLTIDDYYRTDSHWTQERIMPVAEKLASAMGVSECLTPLDEYEKHTLSPFYGVYLGSVGLSIAPDELTYLTSRYTESATVRGAEGKESPTVYDPARIDGMDGYDVFLSGAQAILTVECPDAKTDKELIIFRDSFGSSLAPLFLGAYSKVTLIDLRYVSSMMLGNFPEYFTFGGQDVLFIYSPSVLNNSDTMI